MLNTPLTVAADFYEEHVRRDLQDGRLTPIAYWMILRTLLISAHQTYASICILVADRRPRPLLLQAAVLCRSLFEALANCICLIQAPKSHSRIFERDGFKNLAVRYHELQAAHGTDPQWREYLEAYRNGLPIYARHIHLARSRVNHPDRIREHWPTPGAMVYGDGRHGHPRSFVRGSKRRVLEEIHSSWYGQMSEQAHQRMAAVSVAFIVDQREEPEHPGSNVVSTAMLFFACMLAEVEAAGRYAPHARLLELWTYLREMDEEAEKLYGLRYEGLLQR